MQNVSIKFRGQTNYLSRENVGNAPCITVDCRDKTAACEAAAWSCMVAVAHSRMVYKFNKQLEIYFFFFLKKKKQSQQT